MHRGVTPYDTADTIYLERTDPSKLSTVFRSEDFFENNKVVLMENIVDFEVRDKYMFGTKKVVGWQDFNSKGPCSYIIITHICI